MRFELNQSIGKPCSWHFKLNATDEKSITSIRGKNAQLMAAVCFSKPSVLKLSDKSNCCDSFSLLSNDNRTEWSTIQVVIKRSARLI